METSLKTGFAQIFSCCPKNLSCPNFGGAAASLAPPARTPMHVPFVTRNVRNLYWWKLVIELLDPSRKIKASVHFCD